MDRGDGWFVDTSCIACDVARQVAPGLIETDDEGLSYFTRAPATDEDRLMAWRALLACPTASIGAPRGEKAPDDAYPYEVAPGVHYVGYTSPDSFGANAYFVPREGGGLLVDAPRWVPRLADRLEELGGVAHVLLTHRDDVADAERYARELGARVWIHEDERRAAPDASDLVREDSVIAPGVRAIVVPGHTRGSVMFLVDDALLFSGDSLAWSRETDDLHAFPSATWYSWDVQADSLERLADVATFEWVLPGHGGRGRAPPDEMRRRLLALVARMRAREEPDVW